LPFAAAVGPGQAGGEQRPGDVGTARRDIGENAAGMGVTSRSVNMWACGDRSVPGPVISYLRLFEIVPQAFRDAELALIKEEEPMLKEGMYGIQFASGTDWGAGTLVFENGNIYGVDVAGAKYDGTYEYNKETELIDSKIKVTFPPNVQPVTGLPPQPYEWSFDVEVSFPRGTEKTRMEISTPIGPIDIFVQYMRPIPE